MVERKTRDIGILKALGATRSGIATIFLLSGLFCGLVGSILGTMLGLFFSFNLNEIAGFIEKASKDIVGFVHAHQEGVFVGFFPIWVILGACAIFFIIVLLFRVKQGGFIKLIRALVFVIAGLYLIMSAILIPIFLNPPPLTWGGLSLFPKDVYYLERIPAQIHYPTIVFIVIATMIVSLLFSLYPALKAAKLNPVEAIRRE
jgi:lipoprotein-releasing system permease protein